MLAPGSRAYKYIQLSHSWPALQTRAEQAHCVSLKILLHQQFARILHNNLRRSRVASRGDSEQRRDATATCTQCQPNVIGETQALSKPSSPKNMSSALDNLVTEQVIPDVVDTKPTASISVVYNSGVECQQGNELTPTQVKDQPTFKFDSQPDKLYTLAMVDPDAPSRKDHNLREILHFLVANIPGNDLDKGDTLAEYVGSGPPQGSGLHRYIFLLFEQKQGKLNSTMKISKNSRQGRPKFSIRNFARENQLGEPIAANFYQAQYDSYVPQLHAQLKN